MKTHNVLNFNDKDPSNIRLRKILLVGLGLVAFISQFPILLILTCTWMAIGMMILRVLGVESSDAEYEVPTMLYPILFVLWPWTLKWTHKND
jgi:hypothetical protein